MPSITYESYAPIVEYIARYSLMFICCAAASILRDRAYTTKRRSKHFCYMCSAAYAIPCTAILVMIYENLAYSLSIGTWACICFFAGLWSREIVALLLNNKIVLVGVKYVAKKAAKKVIDITDDECEQLSEDLHDAIESDKYKSEKPHKARSPDDDTEDEGKE